MTERISYSQRLNYLQRLLATGFSFAVFGIGGFFLRVAVFPLVGLFTPGSLAHRHRSRYIISTTFRWFVNMMRALGILTYEISGEERLGKPGQLIIANHPSLIDVVFLIAFIRDANCVVKGSLKRNPFTRGPVVAAQYVDNDSTADMIDSSCNVLGEGQTLIVFPEGTRTAPQGTLDFHRGAANIALRAATTLTPVVIRVEPTTLTKAEPWYRIPARRFHFSMHVADDIPLQPFRSQGEIPQASRKLNAFLLSFFNRELGRHERT